MISIHGFAPLLETANLAARAFELSCTKVSLCPEQNKTWKVLSTAVQGTFQLVEK